MKSRGVESRGRVGAVAAALALGSPLVAPAQEALFQRPTEVRATLGASRLYTGEYESTQVARVCGETDPMQFFSGERSFLMEFPLDYDGASQVVDVRFHSKGLVGGARESDKFHVSISVKSDLGGEPPAYVVDTERPTPGDSGRARLEAGADGTHRIEVEAKNALGETLDLTFVCRPRPQER